MTNTQGLTYYWAILCLTDDIIQRPINFPLGLNPQADVSVHPFINHSEFHHFKSTFLKTYANWWSNLQSKRTGKRILGLQHRYHIS